MEVFIIVCAFGVSGLPAAGWMAGAPIKIIGKFGRSIGDSGNLVGVELLIAHHFVESAKGEIDGVTADGSHSGTPANVFGTLILGSH